MAKPDSLLIWAMLGVPALASIPACFVYFVTLMMLSNPLAGLNAIPMTVLMLLLGSIPIAMAGAMLGVVPSFLSALLLVAWAQLRPITLIQPVVIGATISWLFGYLISMAALTLDRAATAGLFAVAGGIGGLLIFNIAWGRRIIVPADKPPAQHSIAV